MADYRLLKSQMDVVFLLIKRVGFDPLDFEWEELTEADDSSYSTEDINFHRLIHKPSGCAARFGPNFLSYSPGEQQRNTIENKINWLGKLAATERWLIYLKREIDTPDLWSSLASEKELLDSESSTDANSPFSEAEQTKIKLAIEEIKSYITKTQALNDEDHRKVNAKLDYLISASKRLGRIDWKNIFVGTLVSIAWQLSLPGPDFHDLLSFAWQILRQVLGYIISPPLLR